MDRTLPLESEFRFYLARQNDFVAHYTGKVLAIKNFHLLGVFESECEAVHEVSKSHKLGTFLIQRCGPGSESYTQTFQNLPPQG